MKRIMGGIFVALLMVVGLASAANAGNATVHDRRNDARHGIDFYKVHAKRTPRSLFVNTRFSHMGPRINAIEIFYDTNLHKKGPEYRAIVYRGKDGDGIRGIRVYRSYGWKNLGPRRHCGTHARWHYYRHGYGFFKVTIGKRCFGKGVRGPARVHVNTWDFTKYKGHGKHKHPTWGYYDSMKGRHRFSGRI
ncbi:MAG: hypothetical protein ACRDQA_01670 [Nocardioidaceae bacterium]